MASSVQIVLPSYGYTYTPNDPALEGYDLELDFSEIYDLLKNNFSIEEIA